MGNKKKQTKKICEHCNMEFMPRKISQKYCNSNCKVEAFKERDRKSKGIKICVICQGGFYSSYENAQTCGVVCRTKLKNNRELERYRTKTAPKICECGVVIENAGANQKRCISCRDKIVESKRLKLLEAEEKSEIQKDKIYIQPNGVEYYGIHGIIVKGSESWSGAGSYRANIYTPIF